MIPDFNENGTLPEGIHSATLKEIETRYSTNEKRHILYTGLFKLLSELKQSGCKVFYLDGSFITAKENPGDYDGCFDKTEVSSEMKRKLYPTPGDYAYCRHCQLSEYKGEVKFALDPVFFDQKLNQYINYLSFYQQDDRVPLIKGIIKIDLTKEAEL